MLQKEILPIEKLPQDLVHGLVVRLRAASLGAGALPARRAAGGPLEREAQGNVAALATATWTGSP